MFISIVILAALGLLISIYTYGIELKIKRNPQYKPVCDLSDRISCSKPIQSQYAHMFFISNAMMGIIFYFCVILLAVVEAKWLIICGVVGSCIVSCCFAYLLYIKLKTVCLLCTALYVINFLLLYYSLSILLHVM